MTNLTTHFGISHTQREALERKSENEDIAVHERRNADGDGVWRSGAYQFDESKREMDSV